MEQSLTDDQKSLFRELSLKNNLGQKSSNWKIAASNLVFFRNAKTKKFFKKLIK